MRTMITAHSGAEMTPENSMESIRVLAAIGADALEIDVNRIEGKLVLSHDRPQPGVQYAALEECFEHVASYPSLKVNVDIKAPDIVSDVIVTAERCGVKAQILFTGDVLTEADRAAARNAGVAVWYNHTQVPEGTPLLQGAENAGYDVLNVNYRLVTDDMLCDAERLSLWTVSEEAALRRFLSAGVRNITTRIPLLAMKLREELQ